MEDLVQEDIDRAPIYSSHIINLKYSQEKLELAKYTTKHGAVLIYRLSALQSLLKLTILQNKSRKFNEWLFDPDHYAGKWHKKNMLRDFIDS